MGEEIKLDVNMNEIQPVEDNDNQEVQSMIIKAMDRFTEQRRNLLEQRWRDAETMSHGKSTGKYYNGQSKVTVPAVHNAIRSVASRIRDVLWGGIDNFDLRATKGIKAGVAEIIKNFIRFQLGHLGPEQRTFYNVFYGFAWDVCTYGKGFMKVTWQMNEGKKRTRVWRPVTTRSKDGIVTGIKMKPVTETVDTTLYDGLYIENVSIFDIYVDATITDMQKQPIVIHRIISDWQTIKGKMDSGVYPFATESMKSNTMGSRHANRRSYSKTTLERQKDIDQTAQPNSDNYELLEAYFWKDGTYKIATVMVGANNNNTLQNEEFPYLHNLPPIIDADFERDNLVFYGYGIPDLTGENQIELNDNRRRINDFGTFSLNNMWIMDTSSGMAPQYLFNEPGKVIPSDTGTKGLEPLRPDATAMQLGLQMENLAINSIQEASAAPASLQGLPTRAGTTATESSQILNQAGVAIVDIAKNIENMAIQRMLRMVYLLDRQFIIQEQVVLILGEDGFEYPKELQPWEMREDIDFVATGSLHMQNRMVLAQQMTNLLQMAMARPDLFNLKEITKDLGKAWDIANSERYINSDVIETSTNAADENKVLALGQQVRVKKSDDDLAHIAMHNIGAQKAPEGTKFFFLAHAQEHEESFRDKIKQQEQAELTRGTEGDTGRTGTNHSPTSEKGIKRQADSKGKPQVRGAANAETL